MYMILVLRRQVQQSMAEASRWLDIKSCAWRCLVRHMHRVGILRTRTGLWGTVASMYEDMIASLSDLYILDVISAFRGF